MTPPRAQRLGADQAATNGAPLIVPIEECHDRSRCGGKAVNLGQMIRAGLPVPGGFVITTGATDLFSVASAVGQGTASRLDGLRHTIIAAYHALGCPPVAVRSSATAEDLADASMAGQYETILDVRDEDALLAAIARCHKSLSASRVKAYLAERGHDVASASIAVIVQKLVPADASGVIFCADPRTGSSRHILIEAAWGLGEAIVSGKVQPDILRLDAETGQVLEAKIAEKEFYLPPGGEGLRPVPAERRAQRVLRPSDVRELWQLAQKVSDHFGSPQDIEFALHDGQIHLLQARPITTLGEGEALDELINAARQDLRDASSQGLGPWVLHNLAETLPHPTPLTWSIIQRFMSASGGYGRLYRTAGYEPCPTLSARGFLRRIGGRIYMDLSLAPRMFFGDFPFRYDMEEIRANPDAAQCPPTIPDGSLTCRLKARGNVQRAGRKLRRLAEDCDKQLEIASARFTEWCHEQRLISLNSLSADQILELWQTREQNVLDDFAPQSLLPSLIVSMHLADLKAVLAENRWDEDADVLAATLASASLHQDQTLLMNGALHDLAHGRITVERWLTQFGHRAPAEFDLATPRWRERPEELLAFASRLKDAPHPADLHRERLRVVERELDRIGTKLKKSEFRRLQQVLGQVHRYMRWREDGKHALMLGYALMRDLAVEMGRRLEIGDNVFHLTLDELSSALRSGYPPHHLIEKRKRAFRAEAHLTLPRVITSDDINSIRQPSPPSDDGESTFAAHPLSTGIATGAARILRSPSDEHELGRGYILICSSTDPGWTPLFINAAGLIIETGGMLSHGAIVAREMNRPAVVLPGATNLFKDGEILTVDATHGLVGRANTTVADHKTLETRTKRRERPLPPIPGRRERLSHLLLIGGMAVWTIYLAAVFLLPEHWLYQPSLHALDALLWPIIRTFGKPGGVAAIAGVMAVGTLIAQLLLTDNSRLREANHRSRNLEGAAAALPRDSPKRKRLLDRVRSVQLRTTIASFVPLAILLGPMTMIFLWFPARVDPTVWNAPPGSSATITAMVDGNAPRTVRLHAAPLELDRSPEQSTEPIRTTLETLSADLASPSDLSNLPWELQELSQQTRQNMLMDLRAFLAEGVPPQPVAWRVQTPPNQPGRFIVTASTVGAPPLSIPIVVGDKYPPGPREILADPESHLRSIKVSYPPPPRRPLFWQPFSYFVSRESSLHYWEAGWLSVYLLAYIPTLLLFRWMLRIA